MLREAVDRLPASGGTRGRPPINTPEVITKDRKVFFVLRFSFEDFGRATLHVER